MPSNEPSSSWVVVNQVRTMRETVYGVKTHYMHGGAGEPVVLVHGGGSFGEISWKRTIPALAPYFHAYAPDLIGCGYTDKPRATYSFQTQVDHLAGFIDALALDQVRLAGNSQGAYVAIRYALDHPARVKQAALIATGTLATALGLERAREGPRPPRFDGTRASVRKAVELLINDPAKITDELIEARMAVALLPGHQEAHESIQRFRQTVGQDPDQRQIYDVRARLPYLTVPWCLIWGDADVSAPLDPLGYAVHETFPQVPFFVVEGSGHQVQNDKPEECNRILLQFFRPSVAASAGA